MQVWRPGNAPPRSTTRTRRHGKPFWITTIMKYTNMLHNGWPRSTRTRTTIPAHQTGSSSSAQNKATQKGPHRPLQTALAAWESMETPSKWVPMPYLPNQSPPRAPSFAHRRTPSRRMRAADCTNPRTRSPSRESGWEKPARASRIATLLKTQQEHPTTPDEHRFEETTGYLKCSKCNQAIHKRANEELFNQFLQEQRLHRCPIHPGASCTQRPHLMAGWKIHPMQGLWDTKSS